MFADLEDWLKNTIVGIIFLGALGSVVGVFILRSANYLFNFIPYPFVMHRDRSIKQAYMLGFAAAIINRDKTGRTLISVLIFHLMCFIVETTILIIMSIIFIVFTATKSGATLTVGGVVSSGVGFVAIYLIYFEFEYVYRTYLFFWKGPLRRAEEAYTTRKAKISAEKPNSI